MFRNLGVIRQSKRQTWSEEKSTFFFVTTEKSRGNREERNELSTKNFHRSKKRRRRRLHESGERSRNRNETNVLLVCGRKDSFIFATFTIPKRFLKKHQPRATKINACNSKRKKKIVYLCFLNNEHFRFSALYLLVVNKYTHFQVRENILTFS